MKNIYLLQTDKPSRLWTNNLRRRLELDEFPSQHPSNIAKHLYITSDEEIKEGDYVFNLTSRYVYSITELWEIVSYERKIILTTDQDLINDGVQAIDDEFLQWFVKNPSCRQVKIESWQTKGEWDLDYKIIIPKEKPKNVYKMALAVNNVTMSCTNESKQETLVKDNKWSLEKAQEFALEKFRRDDKTGLYKIIWDKVLKVLEVGVYTGHKFGAKWQQEQSENKYSEEEVLTMLLDCRSENPIDVSKWFEQFKKQ